MDHRQAHAEEFVMRKVAYCAAGTFVSFGIPNGEFDALGQEPAAGDDMRAPCTVLERVVAGVRAGNHAEAGPEELRAACRIWQFCNQGRETGEDVVVVDYMGDGKSIEFAPLAELECSAAIPTCTCLRASSEAKRKVVA